MQVSAKLFVFKQHLTDYSREERQIWGMPFDTRSHFCTEVAPSLRWRLFSAVYRARHAFPSQTNAHASTIASGRTGDPVAPTNLRGDRMKRNSFTLALDSPSRSSTSIMWMPFSKMRIPWHGLM